MLSMAVGFLAVYRNPCRIPPCVSNLNLNIVAYSYSSRSGGERGH